MSDKTKEFNARVEEELRTLNKSIDEEHKRRGKQVARALVAVEMLVKEIARVRAYVKMRVPREDGR